MRLANNPWFYNTKNEGKYEMKIERYVDKNGKRYVRVKFVDRYGTEVIMEETEFEERYGKIE